MRNPIRTALAALSVATLALTLAGCADVPAGSSPGGPDPVKACDTWASAPVLSMTAEVPTIYAKATSVCDVAPASHQVTIWLERQTGGDWLQYGSSHQCLPEIPGPGHDVVCDLHTFTCESGVYRTHVLVAGTDSLGKGFSFDVPERPSAQITCPQGR